MHNGTDNPAIDVVYTWVDDSYPGYMEEMHRYASDHRDFNPNRTRDNLDIIRYSLRSLQRHAPWVGNVYLLTCRPQVPDWLNIDHPRVRLVHHDEIMAPEILPTYNSFAIVSHLHLLPGLSNRFVYFEDDCLFLNDLELSDLVNDDGKTRIYQRSGNSPVLEELDLNHASPWNMALAENNRHLDAAYGARRRQPVEHVPLFIDKAHWTRMIESCAQAVKEMRTSRFRSRGNVALECYYPQFLLHEDLGVPLPPSQTRRFSSYASLENFLPLTAIWLAYISWRRRTFCVLNDSFGENPNGRVVQHIKKVLERWHPEPSEFEKS